MKIKQTVNNASVKILFLSILSAFLLIFSMCAFIPKAKASEGVTKVDVSKILVNNGSPKTITINRDGSVEKIDDGFIADEYYENNKELFADNIDGKEAPETRSVKENCSNVDACWFLRPPMAYDYGFNGRETTYGTWEHRGSFRTYGLNASITLLNENGERIDIENMPPATQADFNFDVTGKVVVQW